LLDCQFMTEHLASLGAIEISQERYLELLRQAHGVGDAVGVGLEEGVGEAEADAVGLGTLGGAVPLALPAGFAALLAAAEGDSISPGKVIEQALTQTS